MNAIEHGNENQPDVPVEIRVSTSGAVRVRITDHGGADEVGPTHPDLEAKLDGLQTPARVGLVPDREHGRRGARPPTTADHTLELVMRLRRRATMDEAQSRRGGRRCAASDGRRHRRCAATSTATRGAGARGRLRRGRRRRRPARDPLDFTGVDYINSTGHRADRRPARAGQGAGAADRAPRPVRPLPRDLRDHAAVRLHHDHSTDAPSTAPRPRRRR